MKYYLKILKEDKVNVKMNNQTDYGFDLIILKTAAFDRIINKLNYLSKRNIQLNIAWEFKTQRGSFKVYQNAQIKINPDSSKLEIKDNINPYDYKVDGKVISFICEGVNYYSLSDGDIGFNVPRTNKIWKDSNILYRALKLSNIKFDIKN